MFYGSFVTHPALFPLATPVAPECALSHHSPLHHRTQFSKRPAGRLEVFSPPSFTQLLQARSLPPVPRCAPASQNLCVVCGGNNGGSLLMHSPESEKKEYLKSITLQKLEKSCNEGMEQEQHVSSFAGEG